MPRWHRPRRQGGAMRTLGLALVLFLLLCGAALVLTGRSHAPAQRVRPAQRVHEAMQAINSAGQALEAMDYGKARKHLAHARTKLEVLAATIE